MTAKNNLLEGQPEDLRLGDGCAHLRVDAQRMFFEKTEWHTPWFCRVLPQIERIVKRRPRARIRTRLRPFVCCNARMALRSMSYVKSSDGRIILAEASSASWAKPTRPNRSRPKRAFAPTASNSREPTRLLTGRCAKAHRPFCFFSKIESRFGGPSLDDALVAVPCCWCSCGSGIASASTNGGSEDALVAVTFREGSGPN